MKRCNKCGKEKEIAAFYKDDTCRDGVKNACKDCVRIYGNAYAESNRERQKEYRRANKEKIAQYAQEYYQVNREEKLLKQKKYREANIETVTARQKVHYIKNREKVLGRSAEWRKQNAEYLKLWHRNYKQNQYKNNPNYRLTQCIRTRIRSVLKNIIKIDSTVELVGCTIEELWTHLENQFTEGMTRENHGEWHIDHRIPCAAFDLNDEEQQKICFHYTNLQPLWARDNLSKGSRAAV